MDQQERGVITGFTPAEVLDGFSIASINHPIVSAWVHAKLHPEETPACPGCGHLIPPGRALKSFTTGGRVCCLSCKKFFSNRTNTILHGSTLEFETLYLIAFLSALSTRIGADPRLARREIARITGLCTDSIRKWEAVFSALESPLV